MHIAHWCIFQVSFCFDDSSASIWKLVWFATGVHWKCFCPEALLLSLPDVGENWWLSWYVGGVFSRNSWGFPTDVWGFPKKKSSCSCKLHPFQFRWQEEEQLRTSFTISTRTSSQKLSLRLLRPAKRVAHFAPVAGCKIIKKWPSHIILAITFSAFHFVWGKTTLVIAIFL